MGKQEVEALLKHCLNKKDVLVAKNTRLKDIKKIRETTEKYSIKEIGMKESDVLLEITDNISQENCFLVVSE